MEIRTVTACYFSPTDTTKKTVEAIARGIRPVINILDLTLPSAREAQYHFGPEDLLVIGAPVYGGRIPLVEEEDVYKRQWQNWSAAETLMSKSPDFSLPFFLQKTLVFQNRGFLLKTVFCAAF